MSTDAREVPIYILRPIVYRVPILRGLLRRLAALESQEEALSRRMARLESRAEAVSTVMPLAASTSSEPAKAVATFFEALEGPEAATAWEVFHRELTQHYNEFSAGLGRHLPGDDLIHLLELLLVAVFRNGFRDEATKLNVFERAQAMGGHVLTVHFYSPVPNTAEIAPEAGREPFQAPVDYRLPEQLALLSRLSQWTSELEQTPPEGSVERPAGFFWNNPAFGPMDALTYYGMIREFKPGRVLEVGSGFSTLLAVKAAQANGQTVVDCVEPYPLGFLKGLSGIRRLMVSPVQEVPLAEFQALEANDILFVDSTHVSKFGSDVNHLLLNVLPQLKPGVLVHFHDIFLPYDYPTAWVREKKIFWNEGYLFLAFLMFNAAWEVMLSNNLLSLTHLAELRSAFPFSPALGGASFWIRRL